ncbi:receptor-interacting serine/threonine-protein kinase 3-like isoform X2 [Protopterus annectens]|nr:receptor-interacting serine/threonine-protein kinase 3-like isoform X2 [Protopterus annectens]
MMNRIRFQHVLRMLGIYQEKMQDTLKLGIVMEYMENGSLSSLLVKVVPVPWALRFRILYEVALGMNYLHGLDPPLLHLDLKPSNILLDESFHVKLTDFGLSRWKMASVSSLNGESSVGGTLEYMAPEVLSNLNHKPTLAMDIYSYGILMWSVLTAKQPYSEARCSSLIKMAIPTGQRPDTSYLAAPEIPEELKELMEKCWCNDPKERPNFKECIEKTSEVFQKHKCVIQDDVRRVQDVMSKMATSACYPSMEERMARMNLDRTFEQTGSKPKRLSSQIETPSSEFRSPSMPQLAEARVRTSPQEDTYQGSMPMRLSSQEEPPRFVPAPPMEQRPEEIHKREYIQQNTSQGTVPLGPYRCPMPSVPQPFLSPPSYIPERHSTIVQQGTQITFAGSSIKNVQIGNNNLMEIYTTKKKKKKKKKE